MEFNNRIANERVQENNIFTTGQNYNNTRTNPQPQRQRFQINPGTDPLIRAEQNIINREKELLKQEEQQIHRKPFTPSTPSQIPISTILTILLVIAILGNIAFFGLKLLPGRTISDKINNIAAFSREKWNTINPFKALFNFYKEQYDLTVGDLYTGQVDDSSKEPLGVFLKPISLASPTLYDGERITLFSTIKVNTFDKPVNVNLDCSADNIKGEVYPDKSFTVNNYNERTINCMFDEGMLDAGAHLVKIKASFNFETTGYLKNYFINKETYMQIVSKDKSVWDVYKTDEENPIAKFSQGPVYLGIETGVTQPIVIDPNGDYIEPYLKVSIKNQWSGVIDRVNNLIIYTPKGIELDTRFCSSSFKRIESDLQGYNAFALNSTKWLTNITTYKSLGCKLDISDPGEVLGDNPIVHKFFFVKVSYNYTLSQVRGITVSSSNEFCRDPKNKGKICDNSKHKVCDGSACISICAFCAKNVGATSIYEDVECDPKITSTYSCTNSNKGDDCISGICPGDMKCCNRFS